jgi:hypothetical protein
MNADDSQRTSQTFLFFGWNIEYSTLFLFGAGAATDSPEGFSLGAVNCRSAGSDVRIGGALLCCGTGLCVMCGRVFGVDADICGSGFLVTAAEACLDRTMLLGASCWAILTMRAGAFVMVVFLCSRIWAGRCDAFGRSRLRSNMPRFNQRADPNWRWCDQ